MRRHAQVVTRFMLLVFVIALGMLCIGAVLTSCTLVVVRGNDISMNDIGGHGGGVTFPQSGASKPGLPEKFHQPTQ